MALLALNLAPLLGVLLLGWSVLEVVAYAWLEAVVLVLYAALRVAVAKRWLALAILPPFLLAMGLLLALQLLLLTLAFFVMRFETGFFEVVAEGERVARGVLWAAGVLAAWHAVGFALWLRAEDRPRTRVVLGGAAAHVLVLLVFSVASVYVVRDLDAPALALGLLVLMEAGVDAGAYALERRLAQARPWSQQRR